MRSPDFTSLIDQCEAVVERIERESVDVYLFLAAQFERGPVHDNSLFQFVYRSFYRLDNAGLTPKFKKEYFQCMQDARGSSSVDVEAIARKLYPIPNRKGQESLQFSFVTKLANTIDCKYPIYDGEIARYFDFK